MGLGFRAYGFIGPRLSTRAESQAKMHAGRHPTLAAQQPSYGKSTLILWVGYFVREPRTPNKG